MSTKNAAKRGSRTRYEFRVWGDHPKACRKLATMATEETRERFEDCYLLGDDQNWNAKVRDSALKVKRLVATERGFDRWDSRWHTTVETVPEPFEEVFQELALDRPSRGKSYDLARAVKSLDEEHLPTAVFVTKRRRRYRFGSVRAEVSEIKVRGRSCTLKSVAIEGDNLDELVALRRELGLKGKTNVAVHVALENEALAEAS